MTHPARVAPISRPVVRIGDRRGTEQRQRTKDHSARACRHFAPDNSCHTNRLVHNHRPVPIKTPISYRGKTT
jgi:hypothetical protein